MTKIANLLSEQVREQVKQAVVADLNADAPAGGDIPFIVRKASTEPNPPRTLTEADAIDIDPESEAMIEASCVDCRISVLIEPRLPEGVEADEPRVPICAPCAKARAIYAYNNRRNIMAIRRTRVAKHEPRTTDHIDHPVTTKSTTANKENDMDLDNMTDAELGALVRSQMKATLAEQTTAAKIVVEAERAEQAAKTDEAIAAEQVERPERILQGFTLRTKSGAKDVPTLDLSDVTWVALLDEVPSAKERSPYNKALSGIGEPILDKETTTYADLMKVHERLWKMARKQAKGKGKAKVVEAEPVEPEVQVIAAHLDPDEKAIIKRKVKALMAVTGLDKKQAKALVLAQMG